MSSTLLFPIVVASLFGSLHCAAMCGTLVASYAGNGKSLSGFQHAAYNAGRLAAYTALGAIGGSIGRSIDLAGSAAGVGRTAAIVAGVLMVVWGLSAMLETQGIVLLKLRMPERIWRKSASLFAGIRGRSPVLQAGLLGLASALLPCGWLYAFVVTAAGTASAASGAAVMVAFWIGTVPMLLGLGIVVHRVSARVRRHVPLLSAAVILILGLHTVIGRSNMSAFAEPGHPPGCPHHSGGAK